MNVAPVQPFRPLSSYVKEMCCSKRMLVFIAFIGVCTGITGFLALDPDTQVRNSFKVCPAPGSGSSACTLVPPWKALAVADVILLAVMVMAQGARAEFILVSSTILFGLLGIITTAQAFSGFASTGNLVVQALLVICRGIQDAGVLDQVFSAMLGAPRFRTTAMLRSQALSATLAAFVSSCPVAIAGGPALCTWAPQVNLASWEVQMPFAFAANMGQTLLMISSPVSLIVGDKMPEANLALAEPVPICVILCALTAFYALVAARPLLRPRISSAPIAGDATGASSYAGCAFQAGERYLVSFRVSPESMLIGRSPKQAGLLMLPGVDLLGTDAEKERSLTSGTDLRFAVTARGMARLRLQGHGLVPQGPASSRGTLETLGGRRHQRQLYEAVLSPSSSLLNQGLPTSESLRLGICLAARRPAAGASDVESHGRRTFAGPLQAGDTLLIEAFTDFPDLPEAKLDFSFVAGVPNSAPPRHGRPVDTRRGWLAGGLLSGVLLLSAFKVADLSFLSLGACILCVLLNVVHREMVLEFLNLPLYLLIAGGIGLGEAMNASGLANALANLVVHVGLKATPGSSIGVLISVGFITSGLSNLMSSTATAALMVPIVSQICQQQSLNPKTVALVVIYSSNACVLTPFCTAANLICQPFGPYQFVDYVRYGCPLQLVYLFVIPLLCATIFGMTATTAPTLLLA